MKYDFGPPSAIHFSSQTLEIPTEPMRRRRRSEAGIQRATVDHLYLRACPGVWWAAINNNPRSAVAGALAKAAGCKAGLPDLLLVRRGQLYALELKADSGRVSLVQKACHAELREAGAEVAVAHGVDEALAQLEEWGLIRP
jgi:VRR-NUC domain